MRGKLLEDTKNTLSAALLKLGPNDSFSIIAFNSEMLVFSSSVQLATSEALENAIQWMNTNFIAGGGTNILLPLNKVLFLCNKLSVKSSPTICWLYYPILSDKKRNIVQFRLIFSFL